MKVALLLLAICVVGPVAAARPNASARTWNQLRRLNQFAAGDSDTITGSNKILRTNRYSRLSNSAADALQSNDVQSSVQSGDTTLLTSSRATYTAGRTSRDDRNDLAKNDLQSAIQSGSARGASDVATGNTALWSAQGVTSSQGVRSQLAGDAAQGAVRAALDDPADVSRATRTAAAAATGLSFQSNYANWV